MPLPPLTVFDVETTGLDPKKGHRIVEIAGVRVQDNRIIESPVFNTLVNPERDIPWEIKQISAITSELVRDAPTIMTVLPEFLEFAKGTVLVAHNAAFDLGFLECEKEFCWGYTELPEVLCTMKLSQSLYPTAFRHNLDTVAERLKLPVPSAMERHRALPDVMLTASALLKMIEDGKIRSMEELRRKSGLGLGMTAGRR